MYWSSNSSTLLQFPTILYLLVSKVAWQILEYLLYPSMDITTFRQPHLDINLLVLHKFLNFKENTFSQTCAKYDLYSSLDGSRQKLLLLKWGLDLIFNSLVYATLASLWSKYECNLCLLQGFLSPCQDFTGNAVHPLLNY